MPFLIGSKAGRSRYRNQGGQRHERGATPELHELASVERWTGRRMAAFVAPVRAACTTTSDPRPSAQPHARPPPNSTRGVADGSEGGGIGEPPTCQPTKSRLAPMASGSTPIFSQQGDLLSFRHNGDKWQAVHAWLRRARLVVD
jgi:hypothetical protein